MFKKKKTGAEGTPESANPSVVDEEDDERIKSEILKLIVLNMEETEDDDAFVWFNSNIVLKCINFNRKGNKANNNNNNISNIHDNKMQKIYISAYFLILK